MCPGAGGVFYPCREDLDGFTEHVLVKGRLHMWTLNVDDMDDEAIDEYDNNLKLFLRSDRAI